MSYERHRQTNRRAFFSALLIWLVALLQHVLEWPTTALIDRASLALVGLAVLSVLVVWPWLSSYLLDPADDRRLPPPERRHQALVSLEIVMLSVMLLVLLAAGR